jgi:superfamily II DNA or RNA helicase
MTNVTTTVADDDTAMRRPRLPELGQVVEVRGSTWAVTDVRDQGLPRSPADETRAESHHVVTLQSLDEDRLGQELAVVWELEVGHTVAPDQGLPETITGFDDPNRLAAFVDAVRWGAVTSAAPDAFQAPFRSGANVEAYQLEPLRRALQSPRTNLLLADDVGLGKTIEAGLVVQELLLRHRARSVIIVCPPSLSLKWQDEMREKFGLDFVVVNSELMAQVRRTHGLAANPFRLFPRVIVSLSWLPTLRAQRLLRDVYAEVSDVGSARRFVFDVLVVDEAHHVAPASPTAAGGGRGYAVDSKRTIAARALAKVCEHRLFLSATPHNGHPESFTALMEMIDERRFARGADLDAEALKDVAIRRLKTDLPDMGFRRRQIKPLPFEPSADEQEAFATLTQILAESAQANGRGRSGDIVSMLLKKRFLSSPWAFARTLGLYDESSGGAGLDVDDEGDYYAEVLGSSQDDAEEGGESQPEFSALRASKGSDPLVTASSDQLRRLVAWGESYQYRPNARLTRLIAFLDAVCRPGGTWSNQRVVVFTEYASTLEWIVENLRAKGYGEVLGTIQGSTPSDERELTRARFQAHPSREKIRVLVATDSAGEGIDLQDHCHRLVNFDIPFNPSRLEQRIGRIDRYGQTMTPEVFHFQPLFHSTTYDEDLQFMRRIAEKVGNVARDLGSVNDVIDEEIQDHFCAIEQRRKRTKGQTDGNAAIGSALAGGLELNRHLTELARTYDDRKRDMHLTPRNARRVLDTALALTAQPVLEEVGSADLDAPVFRVPDLGRAWQPALRGLDTRLKPGEYRPITFADAADRDERPIFDDVVRIHLGHALMQKAARVLRSSLFSADGRMHRVTAVSVDGLDTSCVAVVSRLVLVGRGGVRLHEEVFLTGVRVRGQALAEEKVETLLETTLDAPDLRLAGERTLDLVSTEWNAAGSRLRSRLLAAMDRRAERRQDQVTERLAARRDADEKRAREIFAAFRANLTHTLAALRSAEAEQETLLWVDEQQAQRRRDIRAMEDRLTSLADEESRELVAIRERYADVRPHVTAAAVVFALTPQDAATGRIS